MDKIDKLTDEQILEIGFQFKYLRDLYLKISVEIINSIGKSKKESNLLLKIEKDLNKLKSNLEELLFYRLTKMEEEKTITNALDVFYGKRNENLVDEVIKKFKEDVKLICKENI